MIEVPGFTPFGGVHCETVATGCLLGHAGIDLSEPMLFGLGEGLGFVLLNLKDLPLPFLGGRSRPFDLTRALCRNLGVPCAEQQTSSTARAWRTLESALSQGLPVGLQLDCYYLEYFSQPVHFAGHFVAAYGVDEDDVLLVDTVQQGGRVRSSRSSVSAARAAKGAMAARARSWTIGGPDGEPLQHTPLPQAVLAALRSNASTYCTPGFGGAGPRGIRALATSLPRWLDRAPDPADLCQAAAFMELAGTGGGLFRRLYTAFLAEARELLPEYGEVLEAARGEMESAAEGWTGIAAELDRAGRDREPAHLREAARICENVAERELTAMTRLAALPAGPAVPA